MLNTFTLHDNYVDLRNSFFLTAINLNVTEGSYARDNVQDNIAVVLSYTVCTDTVVSGCQDYLG